MILTNLLVFASLADFPQLPWWGYLLLSSGGVAFIPLLLGSLFLILLAQKDALPGEDDPLAPELHPMFEKAELERIAGQPLPSQPPTVEPLLVSGQPSTSGPLPLPLSCAQDSVPKTQHRHGPLPWGSVGEKAARKVLSGGSGGVRPPGPRPIGQGVSAKAGLSFPQEQGNSAR